MPTTLDREFKGAAVQTTTTNSINSTDTAVSLSASTGWPTGAQPFTVVIDRGTALEEKCLATARSGLGITLSIRGYDNTTAVAHSSGATIEHCVAAADFDALFRHATDTAIDDHTQYLLKTLAATTYATITKLPVVVSDTVDTPENTNSATPTNLTTAGPTCTVTVPASGVVKVTMTANMVPTGAGYCQMAFAVSGANTLAAGAGNRTLSIGNQTQPLQGQMSATYVIKDLTPGSTTFTTKYWYSNTGPAYFAYRNLIVETCP